MSAHTPGPWFRVKPLGARYWTLGRIRQHVASPLPVENEDADWKLAEAAPDLYAALADLARPPSGPDALCHRGICSESECAECSKHARARAAIEKATT